MQLLKFRTSYGLVGSDVASGDRYLYRQVYKTGDSYTFGEGNNFGVSGIKEGDLGNLNVTWEKARKFNVGVDMNLFDKFSLTFDWFIDKRYDQLVTRNDIPDILKVLMDRLVIKTVLVTSILIPILYLVMLKIESIIKLRLNRNMNG